MRFGRDPRRPWLRRRGRLSPNVDRSAVDDQLEAGAVDGDVVQRHGGVDFGGDAGHPRPVARVAQQAEVESAAAGARQALAVHQRPQTLHQDTHLFC